MNRPVLYVIFSILLILFATLISITLARGYLPDFQNRTLVPTGILVATSDPNGASVYINNKFHSATNSNINLTPGFYDVRLEQDGYYPWNKKIEIKVEEVIKTNVFFFPKFPDLRPLTLTGITSPQVSADQRKIVYSVASASAERNGIWVLELDGTRSLIWGSNQRQIYAGNHISLLKTNFIWSPNNKQILAFTQDPASSLRQAKTIDANVSQSPNTINPYLKLPTSNTNVYYLFDSTTLNKELFPLTKDQAHKLFEQWKLNWEENNNLNLSKIPIDLAKFLENKTHSLSLSPDESKILYVASASATIPTLFSSYLPGTNPTQETRNIKPNHVYVYDIKEDRNYFIIDRNISKDIEMFWFPSSYHLIQHDSREIAATDFDGTNKKVLYTGPFVQGLVVPWPNWSKLTILTSLNSPEGVNLYTLNLR